MTAADLASMLAGAALLGVGAVVMYAITRLTRPGRCSCGHSYGCLDRFTGNCTATVLQRHYVSGVHRAWKRVPCPCKEHRNPARTVITEVTP